MDRVRKMDERERKGRGRVEQREERERERAGVIERVIEVGESHRAAGRSLPQHHSSRLSDTHTHTHTHTHTSRSLDIVTANLKLRRLTHTQRYMWIYLGV